jgi:mycothiol synthase
MPSGLDAHLPLIARARLEDGHPPLSDQAIIEARSGARDILTIDGGLAVVSRGAGPRELELVVDPPVRRRGIATGLLQLVVSRAPGMLLAWAHGDHPASRRLAERFGFEPVRRLLELRSSTIHPSGEPADTTPFRPGVDDAEWLAVNAAAFASHPEQGRMTQGDLDARMAESWFDPSDLLLTRDAEGRMTGFCWLKTDESPAEFYAVGVAPSAQGGGLGRGLVNAGLARLEALGVVESALYVEEDSTAAVRLYRSVGFTDYSADIQYRRSA